MSDRQVYVKQEPKIDDVINVMTANPPEPGTMVEIVKGSQVVGVGIVGETQTANTYQVLVVA